MSEGQKAKKTKNTETRRGFLKKTAAIGGATLLAGTGLGQTSTRAQDLSREKQALYLDHSLCIECQACRVACQNENDFPITAQSIRFKSYEQGSYPEVEYRGARLSCFHCNDAPCIDICPVDALEKDVGEMTVTDIETCIGCEMCVTACPYGVPEVIDEKMYKCNGCDHLLVHDQIPACVTTCPTYAMEFGSQKEMAELGRERVSNLEAEGEVAYLYGLEAQDGLGLLMVLRASPENFDLV